MDYPRPERVDLAIVDVKIVAETVGIDVVATVGESNDGGRNRLETRSETASTPQGSVCNASEIPLDDLARRLQPHKGPSVTEDEQDERQQREASTPQGSVCNGSNSGASKSASRASTPQGSVCNAWLDAAVSATLRFNPTRVRL